MVLDTLDTLGSMPAARALYPQFGFVQSRRTA
jgi:hypothetical protein